MKITCFQLDLLIDLEGKYFHEYIFGDQAAFQKFLFLLYQASLSQTEEVLFFHSNQKQLRLEKEVHWIPDPLTFQFPDRVIMKQMEERIRGHQIIDEEDFVKLDQILQRIGESIKGDFSIPLEYRHQFLLKDILKLLNFQLSLFEINSIFDKILLLIDVMSEFNMGELLIFQNLFLLLPDEEIEELKKYCAYKKCRILLISFENEDKIVYNTTNYILSDEKELFL